MIKKTVWLSEDFKDELIDGLNCLLTKHQYTLVNDKEDYNYERDGMV